MDTLVELTRPADGITVLWLNRPEKHNAFDPALIAAIHQNIEFLRSDERTRVLILAGRGKSFCSGADLHYMKSMVNFSLDENVADAGRLAAMLQALHQFPKPIIAAVHGNVYAGATGMVACADIIFAADTARFCISEVRLGLVPAVIMSFAVPDAEPAVLQRRAVVKPGGYVVAGLFALTIAMTVSMHNFLHLPPALGMMTGLGVLSIYGFVLRRQELGAQRSSLAAGDMAVQVPEGFKPANRPFDIFISMKRVEWDTLMFFYGVVLSVGGLGALGYLRLLAESTYADLGPLTANVLVGIASAIVDNIPVMFAVLSMNPDMSHGHWLLVTLTAGVGGSLLSIGSAAGVALMGQARGIYTFFGHLRWSWAIALGYAASIWVHLELNAAAF